VSSVPELQQLARLVTGEPRAALRRLLLLVCEQLAMDLAFVSVVDEQEQRTVRVAVRSDGSAVRSDGSEAAGAEGRSEPLAQSWCGRVVTDGLVLVHDTADHPELQRLPATEEFRIASYAGVALRDPSGRLVGTLCALGHTPHASLNERDRAVLQGIGEVVTPLLLALDAPVAPPAGGRSQLAALAESVSGARDLHQLTRPLLEALHDLTGLASTYLTVVHENEGVQEVRYARNAREGFALPEGIVVPWADTLCKRALDEGRPCVTDVPAVWGDSEAAQALGIQVYVSVPVELSDGRVWGTLCAADSQPSDRADEHLPTMRLFARLLASEVEREAVVSRERAKAERAQQQADTDALTGCASRRVVEPWLATNLADLEAGEAVLVLFADVDAFKSVNDDLGHAAGDALLVEAGRRLRDAARPGDLVARLGGDEFVVAARLPRATAPGVAARMRAAMTFDLEWRQEVVPVRLSVGHVVSDGHSASDLLSRADSAMYADKRG
jgi:diguanylate cyclase